MRIGNLNKQVTIQHPTVTRDSVGGLTTTWVDEDTVWAKIRPQQMGSREYYTADQMQEKLLLEVTIRHRWGLTTKKRLAYGTRTFEIISVFDPEEKHQRLVLMCREDDS